MPLKSNSFTNFLWDAFCVSSIVGIWPRFIEPQLITTKKLNVSLQNLPLALKGLKILQFSDLHLNRNVKDSFLEKLIAKVKVLKPDIIVFTGDFLSYSSLDEQEQQRLKNFLNQFEAPYGCYAICGNHDYAEYVSINHAGDYDVIENSSTSLIRAFKRLFTTTILTKKVLERAKQVTLHKPLFNLLAASPFKLLHNETLNIPIKDAVLNICGCGEYILDRFKPQEAFQNYDSKFPGIVLVHNPDAIPHLESYPGEVVLCGHTHGGQVNLPWFWRKFTLLENMQFKKGLFHLFNKWIYINRGVGSVLPFRWFAAPELLLLTLE